MGKQQPTLGKTAKPFLVSSRQENYDLLFDMIGQSQHDLFVFSHNFDGALYDTNELTERLRKLLLNNKNSHARILVQDMNFLVKHGHRIVELGRRLPTSIEIREANKRFEHVNTCYAVADNHGVILRTDAFRFDAKIDYHDPRLAKDLLKQFNEMWEQSEPSTEMQRLHI